MRRVTMIGLALWLATVAGAASAEVGDVGGSRADLSTARRVQGVITAVDAQSLTIAPLHSNRGVTGRLDPKRTRVVVNGRPAKVADLQVTFSAKAEMGLDDVWVSVQADSR
ncbi:MAG: hypothetical protein JNL38_03885 [Myxococcales bacterium]|jgi:hypothetical protein|nr:hypothetical protein [Myxococcales bacterium]